jgi:hypothetical protein
MWTPLIYCVAKAGRISALPISVSRSEPHLPVKFRLSPIAALSPTAFVGLRQCALREVWRATGAMQLLPSSPAAVLGVVIHGLLEDSGRGFFTPGDSSAIELRWNELIAEAEARMASRWLEGHFIPLSRSVPDYEVRRIQARARAIEISAMARRSSIGTRLEDIPESGLITGCEVPVATPDGRIRGRIDAVIVDNGQPVIRDYKSGAIFESVAGSTDSVKESYKVQLRLYAALYASATGVWPVRLELVPLVGEPIPIPFDQPACVRLLNDAYDALGVVNDQIESGGSIGSVEIRLAAPKPEVCRQCSFRPACDPYRQARRDHLDEQWPHDVYGRVVKIELLGNRRLLLEIDSGNHVITIRGITAKGRHPALHLLRLDDSLGAFNLRSVGGSAFVESAMTVIYKSRTVSTDAASGAVPA